MTQKPKLDRLACKLVVASALTVGLTGLSARAGAAPPPPVVNARMVLETDGAHPGTMVKAAVVAEIAPGYHINDHIPSLNYLIPTEVKLEAAKPINVSRAVYPKGAPRKFEFLDTPISVYEGKFVIAVLLKVDATAKPGVYSLPATLKYQACNDHACLAPASVPLTLAVKVIAPGETLRPVNSDVFTGIKFN